MSDELTRREALKGAAAVTVAARGEASEVESSWITTKRIGKMCSRTGFPTNFQHL